MARQFRTFTLKLSPSGVELFMDCHHRLCVLTNELLPYGQTLHTALFHLSNIDPVLILDDIAMLKSSGLAGKRMYFVGGPGIMADVIARTAARISRDVPQNSLALVGTQIMIVSLKRLRLATASDLLDSYRAMIAEAGDHVKMPKASWFRE